MLQVEYTTKFKRDLKLAKRRNKNMLSLQNIITNEKVVVFVRTGTHSDLFK